MKCIGAQGCRCEKCKPVIEASDSIFRPAPRRSVLQDWVMTLPFMQQSVLIAAMRGPDGVDKNHQAKSLCKWLRRCIAISAFDRVALTNPYQKGGGSYTGPSISESDCTLGLKVDGGNVLVWELAMDKVAGYYLKSIDSLPHHFDLHFHLHFFHAAEIIGYKHSDERIRNWWNSCYNRFAKDMHVHGETEAELDARLNDDEAAWRADESRFKK